MTIRHPDPADESASTAPYGRDADLPPFPIPRWLMIAVAVVVLVLPPIYALSFAPAANMMAVSITGRVRIKHVEISSVSKADAERFLYYYGPVVYMVNEVPIFYTYFIAWARIWQVDTIEYK